MEQIQVKEYAQFLTALEGSFSETESKLSHYVRLWDRLRFKHKKRFKIKPWREVIDFEISKIDRSKPLILEFGVFNGSSIKHIADSLPFANIHGFDSFEGFPDDGRKDWDQDFSVAKLPPVPENVALHKGFFENTLPIFISQNREILENDLSLVHIDCDIYSSTLTVFLNIAPFLKINNVIVFDELINYYEFPYNEALAFYQLLTHADLDAAWSCVFGRIFPFSESPSSLPNCNFENYRKNEYYQNHSVKLVQNNSGGFLDMARDIKPSKELIEKLRSGLLEREIDAI